MLPGPFPPGATHVKSKAIVISKQTTFETCICKLRNQLPIAQTDLGYQYKWPLENVLVGQYVFQERAFSTFNVNFHK